MVPAGYKILKWETRVLVARNAALISIVPRTKIRPVRIRG